jgi:hypothetical protein
MWMTLRDISGGRSDIPLRRFGRICEWLYLTFLIDGVTFHCGDSGEFVGDFTWHFWWTVWHSTAEIQAKLWVTLGCDILLRRFRLSCGRLYVTLLVDGVTFHWGDSGEFVDDFTWHFWWFVDDFTWHFWWTEWHSTAEIQANLWMSSRDISGGRSDIPLRRFGRICWWLYMTFLMNEVTQECLF